MTCSCGAQRQEMTANLARTSRRETLEGVDYLVVPVVMARHGVQMNGAVIEQEQMFAESWNGVPVTLGHPETPDGYLTANSPASLTEYGLGRIFNAHVSDGALRGEAWVDIAKANKLDAALIGRLADSDQPIDVSTGYYSEEVEGPDGIKRHVNIRPDHLALLPNEEGACSWADGCGVRTNERGKKMTAIEKLRAFFTNAKAPEDVVAALDELEPKANERGDDDDFRQMVADLISNDASPFMPEDEESLRMMSYDTLQKMRDKFINADDEKPTANSASEAEGAEPNANQENEAPEGDDMTKQKEDAPTANLSSEDKDAVAFARNLFAQHRAKLVSAITANTKMTEDQLKDFDVPKLEAIANGLKATPDYGGRGMAMSVNTSDDETAAMRSTGVVGAINANREGA